MGTDSFSICNAGFALIQGVCPLLVCLAAEAQDAKRVLRTYDVGFLSELPPRP